MDILKKLKENEISSLGNPAYLNSITDTIEYGYLYEDGYHIAFCLKKKFKLWKIALLIGPIMGPNVLTEEAERNFLDTAIRKLNSEKNVDEVMNINVNPTSMPPTDSYYCKFGSYVIDLSLSEDELFGKVHSKHRNVIRKAIKDGLTVDSGQKYKDDCARIIHETFSRQNKVDTASKSLTKLAEMGEKCEFWVVKKDCEIQGCAVLLWDKYSSYYIYGGSCEHTHSGALNLLHWTAILKMKQRGVKYYDFVGARLNPEPGSKLEGIQRFKSRFGGPMKVGYRWRYDNHPIKMKTYRFLMSTYFKLRGEPYNDSITVERKKGNY